MFRSLLALFLFIPAALLAREPQIANAPGDTTLFMRFQSPGGRGRDTLRANSPRLRVVACTNPTAKVFINGEEVKVYGSGAFVWSGPTSIGVNQLHVVARGVNGDSLVRDFTFVRPEPPKPLGHEPAVIEAQSIEPRQDLWLGNGDILEVRFHGSPGYKAYFDIEGVESGISMIETDAKDENGGSGMYVGRYKVKESDETMNVPIRVRLKKSFWSSEKAFSAGKVSIIPQQLPRVVMATARRPFLNAGLGEDRLGGAKLGYISTGVRMQVIGKVGRQYKIKLGEDMIGWFPEDQGQLLPAETPLPRSLVGSTSASGNDEEDIVSVSLTTRLPFICGQIVNPTALTVDIFGASSNTNWMTHQLSAKGIKSVSWDQVAADHYRLTIALNYLQHWGYEVGYDQERGANLRIRLRRPPKIANMETPLAGLTIAVDAGHGGDASGAQGATGFLEKTSNFAIASHIRELLEAKGVKVVMLRHDDTNVGMPERNDLLLQSNARMLVSIHGNSGGESGAGNSTYYRHIGYKPLADIMYGKMLELGLGQFGVIGSFNFSLNAPTQCPNVLIETAFLSNPEDEMKLMDDGFRLALAGKAVEGLEEFVRNYAK